MRFFICFCLLLFLFIEKNASGQNSISFSIQQDVFHQGENITMINNSSAAFKDSFFVWNFGDDCSNSPVYNSRGCEQKVLGLTRVKHKYNSPGIYSITLSVSDKFYQKTIRVISNPSPTPDLILKESFDNNLVTNSGFESYSTCPDKPGQIFNAVGFYSPTPATPDYFNKCSSHPEVFDWQTGVPDNFAGFSEAKEGRAYSGIINFIAEDTATIIMANPGSVYYNYREYIESKLNTPMMSGETYAIQFWVKLSSKSRVSASLGLMLSTSEILNSQATVLNSHQPILKIDKLTDTSWVLISDTIVADKNYEFLVIGNFDDDEHSQLTDLYPHNMLTSNYGNFRAYVSYTYLDAITISHIFNESQERFTLGFAGSQLAANGIEINFTAGQRAFQTKTSQNIILTQGFQQPTEEDLAFRLMPATAKKMNTIEIAAYPNPFNTEIELKILNKVEGNVIVELFDIFGNRVYSTLLPGTDSGFYSDRILLNNIAPGIYNLVVTNNEDIGIFKLVKQ